MDYNVKLLPIVHNDLQKAKKWYHEKSPDLAQEFKTEVNNEIDYLGKNPHHFQKRYKTLRQALINRFPYFIFYLVEERRKRVVVFGVLHTTATASLQLVATIDLNNEYIFFKIN